MCFVVSKFGEIVCAKFHFTHFFLLIYFIIVDWTFVQSLNGLSSDNLNSYLVDPASSHMLVSKIKPCMSKYIPLHGETANGSLNQLWFLRSFILHG